MLAVCSAVMIPQAIAQSWEVGGGVGGGFYTAQNVTSGSGSAKAAGLAPDGSSLAFLSDRVKAEVFQLYLMAEGDLGEARPAPAVPGTVGPSRHFGCPRSST